MKNVQKQKRANKSLPFFFRDEFKVSFVIIFISVALLITTFTFDIVPPILNRGIQPATFPKALLVLIIVMTLLIYYLATKNPIIIIVRFKIKAINPALLKKLIIFSHSSIHIERNTITNNNIEIL